MENYNQGFQNQKKPQNKNKDLVNEFIRFPEVLVIGPEGDQLGVMTRREALEQASSYDLDLICVAPGSNPPVCKILDYGKYKFEAQKKAREAKKKQHEVETKEVQLTPQIGENDLITKAKRAISFFENGDRVKVVVRFRGRQITHPEVGYETLGKFISYVEESSVILKQPILEGRNITVILAPKKK